MKKVLILANIAKGFYDLRQELLRELVKKYEVYVAVPDSPDIVYIENLNCKIEKTPFERRGMNPFKDFKLFITYIKLLNKIKPDIVLSYTIKPNMYGGMACRLKKVPQIANITGLGTAVENGGFLQKILFFMYKITMKKTKCIFFQNTNNLNVFKKNKLVKDNYRLIPGSGVNLMRFDIEQYPNNNIIKFLFIARIMREKGIDEYLDAAKFIKEKYKNTEFGILGTYEQEAYKEKINDYEQKGFVKYAGFKADIREDIKNSNCVILPSRCGEGMATVLLESAATGRPIIATDIHGCRETIDDGINGYICKVKDTQSLADAIEKFINLSFNEQKQMGLKGREKMEKEFDRNIVVKAYLEEIDKCI